jgi:hypothetical protein
MPAAIPRLEKQGMLSRALSLATVTLLIGCLTAGVARAVENLDAGKSPSQIFSNTCSACHKSTRGLLKNTSASSLPGFLRQHYTTGTDMASVLSSYLIANGAADPRYQSKDKPKKDAKQDARQDGRPDQPERLGRRSPPAAPAQEAARPDAEGASPQGEGARRNRDAKRFGRSRAAPEAAMPAEGQAPAQAATDSKSGVKQKQGRRGRPVAQEPPKTEQVAPGDAAKEEDALRDAAKAETAVTNSKTDPAKTDPAKTEPAKTDPARTDPASTDPAKTDTISGDRSPGEATKPIGEPEKSERESGPETAKVDGSKENIGSEPNPLRADPVPPVVPAPPAPAATRPDPSASTPATTSATSAPAPATAPPGLPAPPISR